MLLFETANSYTLWIAIFGGLFGVLGTALTGYFAFLQAKVNAKAKEAKETKEKLKAENEELKSELESYKSELEFDRSSLDFKLSIGQWSQISKIIRQLFDKSRTQRVLLLHGWNGKTEVKFVTALFQVRPKNTVHYSYVHYPVGADYNEYLRRAKKDVVFISVPKLDETNEVAKIYREENPQVVEAAWRVLASKPVDETRELKFFMSVGTFHEKGFTDSDRNLIRRKCFEIEGIVNEEIEGIHLTK